MAGRRRLALAAAAAAVAALLAVPAALDAQAPRGAIGFDHASHEGKVVVAGKDAVACATCHPIARAGALIGRPGHAACLGACHGAVPRPGVAPSAEQEEVCASCHAAADLAARRGTVAYPPYQNEPDFGLTISHASHASAACTTCHRIPGGATAPAAKPHTRCAGCHDGRAAAAPMTSCLTCHLAAFGVNASPRLVQGPLAVGETFSHRRHAARPASAATRDALSCAGCHRGIATATVLELPTPTTESCATAGCHDGAAAFATTVSCRRCHTAPPPTAMAVIRPPERFSHSAHAGRLALEACATCHNLDAKGEPRSAGHAACATCHAADFAAAVPRICGACHASTEPWRALVVDRMPPPTSDFGAAIDHGRHQGIACERCHSLTTTARQLRPPRGHVACSGSGCHAAKGGAAPALDRCDACHRIGLERDRIAERTAAPWSVRSRFRHDVHRAACDACHTATADAGHDAVPAAPAKATCAPCHDGKLTFKMTGHGCARCHGGRGASGASGASGGSGA